jgi:hypothetical protein
MYMTENDVAIVFRDALKRVGSCLGVENIDLKSNAELYDEIANSGSDLVSPLNAFFRLTVIGTTITLKETIRKHFRIKNRKKYSN